MKHLLTIASLIALSIEATAQTEYCTQIHYNDGKTFAILNNEIDSITFPQANSIDSNVLNPEFVFNVVKSPKLYVFHEEGRSFLPNGNKASSIYVNTLLNDSLSYGIEWGNKTATLNKNFDLSTIYLSVNDLRGGYRL